MSATAIQLLNHLRENGVEDERAVKIAEALDLRVKEALEEAKSHSDKNRAEAEARAERARAESEARTEARFVSVDEYHKRDRTLATRDDINAAIAPVRAEISEQRKETRAIYHLLIGVFLTMVAGFAALVGKLFFGV